MLQVGNDEDLKRVCTLVFYHPKLAAVQAYNSGSACRIVTSVVYFMSLSSLRGKRLRVARAQGTHNGGNNPSNIS